MYKYGFLYYVNMLSCLSLHYLPDMNENTSLEKMVIDMINIIEIKHSRVRRINLIYIFMHSVYVHNKFCLLKDEINKKVLCMR